VAGSGFEAFSTSQTQPMGKPLEEHLKRMEVGERTKTLCSFSKEVFEADVCGNPFLTPSTIWEKVTHQVSARYSHRTSTKQNCLKTSRFKYLREF